MSPLNYSGHPVLINIWLDNVRVLETDGEASVLETRSLSPEIPPLEVCAP